MSIERVNALLEAAKIVIQEGDTAEAHSRILGLVKAAERAEPMREGDVVALNAAAMEWGFLKSQGLSSHVGRVVSSSGTLGRSNVAVVWGDDPLEKVRLVAVEWLDVVLSAHEAEAIDRCAGALADRLGVHSLNVSRLRNTHEVRVCNGGHIGDGAAQRASVAVAMALVER